MVEPSLPWRFPVRAAITILFALSAFAGCQESQFERTDRLANAEPMLIPTDYRQQIAVAIKSGVRDAASVRGAEVSSPREMFMGAGTRVASCVRFNAKNGFGGFTGKETYIAVFLGGKLNGVDRDETSLCFGVTDYAPFPEANGSAK